MNSQFEHVLVMAHSSGGKCVREIQTVYRSTFYEQVTKIAITSSRIIEWDKLQEDERRFMKNNCVHYVASKLELGEEWKKKFA